MNLRLIAQTSNNGGGEIISKLQEDPRLRKREDDGV
jgi:hypothetical protein